MSFAEALNEAADKLLKELNGNGEINEHSASDPGYYAGVVDAVDWLKDHAEREATDES